MKKHILAFILGSCFAWYVSFQGTIPTLYYKVMQPEKLKDHKIFYNFKIESENLSKSDINLKSEIQSIKTIKPESQIELNKKIESANNEPLGIKNRVNILQEKPLITLYYHYDNTGSPINDKTMFNLLSQISNSWLKCGVKLKMFPNDNNKSINNGFIVTSLYAGGAIASDDNINNFYIVWVKNNEFSGETFIKGSYCDDCSNKDTEISSYNIKLEKNYSNLKELKHVLIHEFGHAIGLPHSSKPTDIMFPTVDKSGLPQEPSDNDILNCKKVLLQLDLNKSQNNIDNDK